jgi:uncharacterized repeat protein (TIGR02543 family)
MYEENKKRINWVSKTLRIILLVLVILLSIKLILIINDKKETKTVNNEYNKLLTNINNYANDYFNEDNIPEEVGSTKIISLSELIESNVVEDNNKCDKDKSYIKVVRLDNEYQIKSYLTCEDYEDSLITYIDLSSTSTTTTTTSKVTTTSSTSTSTSASTSKKTTTTTKRKTTKKYTISFNSNGGNVIDDIRINANTKLSDVPTPVREGYKFLGWYYHGKHFNFNDVINQDYVFTARWVKE